MLFLGISLDWIWIWIYKVFLINLIHFLISFLFCFHFQQLRIQASDGGGETARSMIKLFTLSIININDNDPVFPSVSVTVVNA